MIPFTQCPEPSNSQKEIIKGWWPGGWEEEKASCSIMGTESPFGRIRILETGCTTM